MCIDIIRTELNRDRPSYSWRHHKYFNSRLERWLSKTTICNHQTSMTSSGCWESWEIGWGCGIASLMMEGGEMVIRMKSTKSNQLSTKVKPVWKFMLIFSPHFAHRSESGWTRRTSRSAEWCGKHQIRNSCSSLHHTTLAITIVMSFYNLAFICLFYEIC